MDLAAALASGLVVAAPAVPLMAPQQPAQPQVKVGPLAYAHWLGAPRCHLGGKACLARPSGAPGPPAACRWPRGGAWSPGLAARGQRALPARGTFCDPSTLDLQRALAQPRAQPSPSTSRVVLGSCWALARILPGWAHQLCAPSKGRGRREGSGSPSSTQRGAPGPGSSVAKTKIIRRNTGLTCTVEAPPGSSGLTGRITLLRAAPKALHHHQAARALDGRGARQVPGGAAHVWEGLAQDRRSGFRRQKTWSRTCTLSEAHGTLWGGRFQSARL